MHDDAFGARPTDSRNSRNSRHHLVERHGRIAARILDKIRSKSVGIVKHHLQKMLGRQALMAFAHCQSLG